MGCRGACLAMGLVRGSVRHYCLWGCIALFVCARRSRQVQGVGAGTGSCVSCLPHSPPSRSPRCVWRAVPSGYPLSSPTGTPFHAVCVFHRPGPVALLVFPVCPMCVCVLALPRRLRPFPLPGSVWHWHPALSRCRALPPSPRRRTAPDAQARPRGGTPPTTRYGGTETGPPPPLSKPDDARNRGRKRGGARTAWNGPTSSLCGAPTRGRGRGAPRRGGSLYLGQSLCLPWPITKAAVIGVAQFMEVVVSILLRFVSAC